LGISPAVEISDSLISDHYDLSTIAYQLRCSSWERKRWPKVTSTGAVYRNANCGCFDKYDYWISLVILCICSLSCLPSSIGETANSTLCTIPALLAGRIGPFCLMPQHLRRRYTYHRTLTEVAVNVLCHLPMYRQIWHLGCQISQTSVPNSCLIDPSPRSLSTSTEFCVRQKLPRCCPMSLSREHRIVMQANQYQSQSLQTWYKPHCKQPRLISDSVQLLAGREMSDTLQTLINGHYTEATLFTIQGLVNKALRPCPSGTETGNRNHGTRRRNRGIPLFIGNCNI